MRVRVYPIPLGIDHCYIIQGEGTIMIDGGAPGQVESFLKAMARIPVRPEEIKLMVITHGHWDHIGSAKDIQEITGAKIAMHRLDKGWLERSSELKPPRPPGVGTWGRILTRMLGMLVSRVRIAATAVDVVLEHEPTSLAQFGIPGEVLHTPGHTPGSVSILLETGEAFVGDLAMNMFPLRLGPGMPVFAHDLDQVRESWTILLDKGAAVIYPGHGKPFPADVMRRALA